MCTLYFSVASTGTGELSQRVHSPLPQESVDGSWKIWPNGCLFLASVLSLSSPKFLGTVDWEIERHCTIKTVLINTKRICLGTPHHFNLLQWGKPFKQQLTVWFSLASLLEALRQNTEGSLIDRVGIAPPPMMHSGIIQAREFDDPPGLHEKTEYLLREWVNLYHSPAAGLDSTKAFSSFVAQVCIAFLMFIQ